VPRLRCAALVRLHGVAGLLAGTAARLRVSITQHVPWALQEPDEPYLRARSSRHPRLPAEQRWGSRQGAAPCSTAGAPQRVRSTPKIPAWEASGGTGPSPTPGTAPPAPGSAAAPGDCAAEAQGALRSLGTQMKPARQRDFSPLWADGQAEQRRGTLSCPSSRQQHRSIQRQVCIFLFICLLNFSKSNKNILLSGECLAKETDQRAQTQNYSHDRYPHLLCVHVYL